MTPISKRRAEFFQKIKKKCRGTIITRREIFEIGGNDHDIAFLTHNNFLEPMTQGIYHLYRKIIPQYLDFILVSIKINDPIICMVSALTYHTKDFYDLYIMCKNTFLLDIVKLKKEVRKVFLNKNLIPEAPYVLKTKFVNSKNEKALNNSWNNIMKKLKVSLSLDTALETLKMFLYKNDII